MEEKVESLALKNARKFFTKVYSEMEKTAAGITPEDITPDNMNAYKIATEDVADAAIVLLTEGENWYEDNRNGKDYAVLNFDGKEYPVRINDLVTAAGGEKAYQDEVMSKASGKTEKPEEKTEEIDAPDESTKDVKESQQAKQEKTEETGEKNNKVQNNMPFMNMFSNANGEKSMSQEDVAVMSLAYLFKSVFQAMRPQTPAVNMDTPEIQRLTTELEHERGNSAGLQTKVTELTKDISDKTSLIVSYKSKLMDSDLKVKQLSAEKDTISKLKDSVETDLNKVKAELAAREDAYKGLDAKFTKEKANVEEARNIAKDLKGKLDKSSGELKSLKDERSKLSDQLKELNQTIDEKKAEIEKLQADRTSTEQAYETLKKEAESKIAELTKQLAEARSGNDEISKLHEQIDKLNEQVKHENEIIMQKNAAITEKDNKISELEKNLVTVMAQRDDLARQQELDPVTGLGNEQALAKALGKASPESSMAVMRFSNPEQYTYYGLDGMNKTYQHIRDELNKAFPNAEGFRIYRDVFVLLDNEGQDAMASKLSDVSERFKGQHIAGDYALVPAEPGKLFNEAYREIIESVGQPDAAETVEQAPATKPTPTPVPQQATAPHVETAKDNTSAASAPSEDIDVSDDDSDLDEVGEDEDIDSAFAALFSKDNSKEVR